MPLEEFAGPGATVDEQSQPAGKDDVETFDLAALRAYNFAGTQLPDGPVGRQPLQLGTWRGAEGFMFRQPIDEILSDHRRDISQSEPDYCLTTYQRGKRVCAFSSRPAPGVEDIWLIFRQSRDRKERCNDAERVAVTLLRCPGSEGWDWALRGLRHLSVLLVRRAFSPGRRRMMFISQLHFGVYSYCPVAARLRATVRPKELQFLYTFVGTGLR
jgi:hypothetical protein